MRTENQHIEHMVTIISFSFLPPVWGSVLIKGENISHSLERREEENNREKNNWAND